MIEVTELNLDTGLTTGRVLTFFASEPREAMEHALYTARLTNGRAEMGVTGLVVYPHGIHGKLAWVAKVKGGTG